ncbi:MAG: heme iron utilization protein [Leptolyngbya foveolarum]|uniref:Heme iron utilization protein n=1 Tax=Leptolyngbya foveolarum TaxID=47253 RepID=A0A2W4TKT7_9CYAN|nr:MAG: heme iron utilization protein [Leptolyngbya foveolarum]
MTTSEKSADKVEKITAQVSDRICKHMNRDHAAAVLTYAQRYGNEQSATAATLTAIDDQGMTLEAEVNGVAKPVRVSFDHELKDAADAHHTLVAMLK